MPQWLVRWLVILWVVCGACDLANAETNASLDLHELTLEQAIERIQKRGVAVVYSTDLVKPWMRVAANSEAAEPVALLDEILAPFGLRARRHSSGVYIVTRGRSVASDTAGVATESADNERAASAPLPEIEVVARPYQLTREEDLGALALLGAEIDKIPQFGGDALRAVSRLPGMAASGFSAQSHFRGGDTDEVSVRFDGLPLRNPYHLKDYQSVFSAIDARLVSTATVYNGAMPVQFGERMSGVVDIAPFAPEPGRYRELAVSLFNTSVLASGDFRTGNGSWMVTARRTNVDLWYPTVNSQGGLPIYGDGFARLGFDLTKSLRATLSTFYFADDLTLQAETGDEQSETVSNDRYYWLRLDHHYGESVSGVTLFSNARLTSHRFGSVQQRGVSSGAIDDHREFRFDAVQTDWTWRPDGNWLLQFGGLAQRSAGRYDYASNAQFGVAFQLDAGDSAQLPNALLVSRNVLTKATGDRLSVYASARVEIAPRLSADLGLRADRQSLDSSSHLAWSPRLGLRYRLAAADDLRLSWGRSVQAQDVDELLIEGGTSLFYRPQATDQLTLGYEHRLAGGIELRLDLYDKRIRDPRPRFENLLNTLTLAPELKPDRVRIAPLSASARGIEWSARHSVPQRPSWWIAYSFAKAVDQFASRQAPRSWDQRHTMSAGLSFDNAQWTFGASVLARSGWPTTSVRADATGPVPLVVAAARNGGNLGSYVSLDLRVARRFELDHGSLSAFFELTNALDRSNPCCTAYDLDEDTLGIDLETRTFLPRFPSLGFVWKF